MAKRDIERALTLKGLRAEELFYSWQPTPEESVPCWTLILEEDGADMYDIDTFHYFDNTKDALNIIATWRVV